MSDPIPILEFDPDREAVIEPSRVVKHRDLPERCVLTFFREVLERVPAELGFEALPPLRSEIGPIPVFRGAFADRPVGVAQAAVGAPLAGGLLEELIVRGGRKFVVCGGAGVLDGSIGSGEIVVPDAAVRDEGTSYHYLPPDREARPSPEAVEAIRRVLDRHGHRYRVGRTWTTDAFYRETPARVARRRAQGCLTVEMEAAAFFAVAEFRGVVLGQMLYGGDDLSGEVWDPRAMGRTIPARERLFRLAVEVAREL